MKKPLDKRTRHRLDEIIEKNLDYLVRFATLRICNHADAEDIVHEAIRKILETDISKVNPDKLRMYLFRIVYNLCRDYHIHEKGMESISVSDYEIPDYTGEGNPDYEEATRLNTLLENLPAREAEIIRMNVMDELSFVEISQILSTPPSTVKSRFKSGMEKLKKQYFKNQ